MGNFDFLRGESQTRGVQEALRAEAGRREQHLAELQGAAQRLAQTAMQRAQAGGGVGAGEWLQVRGADDDEFSWHLHRAPLLNTEGWWFDEFSEASSEQHAHVFSASSQLAQRLQLVENDPRVQHLFVFLVLNF